MPNQYAGQVYPVPNRFIGFGKEAPGSSGTAVAPTATVPMGKFDPADKITFLEDTAWRNAMAGLYNLIEGVQISDVTMGGPLFADTIAYPLAGILGDYWQSVNGTAGTATTLSGGTSVGATAVTLTSATGFATNTIFAVGGTGTTSEEVRKAISVVGSVAYFTPALYQAHLTGAAVTPYGGVTNYTHNFALLNGTGAGMGGFPNAQPPTWTVTDYTGVPATYGARQYAYAVPTELTLSGTSTGLVEWEAKYTAIASAIAAATPTSNPSGVAPQPSWNTTVTIGGTPYYNNIEYKLSLMRKAEPIFGNNAQQAPYAIPRGWMTATIGMNFDPAISEAVYLLFYSNTQPTLTIVASNGLAGSAAASITYTAQVAAFDTGVITDAKEVFGYDLTAKLVANGTNVGPSAGYGPLVVTLVNGTVAY